jgi:hypothetical protein
VVVPQHLTVEFAATACNCYMTAAFDFETR